MTEPQELRSIDELFKSTFDNLPDTTSESGWDKPSDRVWQHVQAQIQQPAGGWSLNTWLLLAGFTTVLVVGMYLAFKPSAPVTTPEPVNSTVVVENSVPKPETAIETPATNLDAAQAPRLKMVKPAVRRQVAKSTPAETPAPSVTPTRTAVAVPLPGSKVAAVPNTTEERKAEHARQLEMLWQTPLEVLPLPKLKQ